MMATVMLLLVTVTGCKKFLDIPLPIDSIAADGAYVSDNSISAVVTGILYNMSNSSAFGLSNNSDAIGFRTALYTDELQNLRATDVTNIAFYTNNILSGSVAQWGPLYKQVYNCNIAIEGIRETKALLANRNQWLGEELFCRAFLYFHLVGLFGDVPLTTSSDYVYNNTLARSPKADVYAQMIADLKEAETLLIPNFLNGFSSVTTDRGRPNQYAAAALLARVYLYTGDYTNAEAQATLVINNTTAFQMVTPATAFLANSRETIFALAPTASNAVRDYGLYNNGVAATVTTPTVLVSFVTASLSQSLLNLFEPGDARYTNWLRPVYPLMPDRKRRLGLPR